MQIRMRRIVRACYAMKDRYVAGSSRKVYLARASPKRGNGLSVVNWWVAREGSVFCAAAPRALNLDLALRCHSLFDWARHGSALFHDRGLAVIGLN